MNSGWARGALALAMVAALSGCMRGADAGGAEAEANLKAGQAFMERNLKAEGVQALPNGIQYKVLQAGPVGGESPDSNDLVRVEYEGSLTDGSVFDSSYERGQPSVFTLGEVVSGWTEALQHMKVGDEWVVYLPADKGYGDSDRPGIPANSVLVFRLKLLDIARAPGGERVVSTANG